MLQVYWQGDAYRFPVTSFEWFTYPTRDLSVHMFQSEFPEHISKIFGLGNSNKYPLTTTYKSGIPINSLPKLTLSPYDKIIFTQR